MATIISKKKIQNTTSDWEKNVHLEKERVFEPKFGNRHLCRISAAEDPKSIPIIPPYVIFRVSRPIIRREIFPTQTGEKEFFRNTIWEPLNIAMYDPIVPSTAQIIYHCFRKNIKLKMLIYLLGPVGDKVEKWIINNANFTRIDFGTLDWNSPQQLEINAIVKYENAILSY